MEIKNIDVVKEFLNSKTSPLVCPICKSLSGFTPFKQEYQQISFPREETLLNNSKGIKYISVVSCRCNNCGFIANFDLDVVTGDSNYSKT